MAGYTPFDGRLDTTAPKLELLETCWGVVAPSQKVFECGIYPNAYNEHLVWGAILVLLLTRGPGVFSLDYLIERYVVQKRLRRRPG